MAGNVTLMTAGGAPIAGNQSTNIADARSPARMQGHRLIERRAHPSREHIPERTDLQNMIGEKYGRESR